MAIRFPGSTKTILTVLYAALAVTVVSMVLLIALPEKNPDVTSSSILSSSGSAGSDSGQPSSADGSTNESSGQGTSGSQTSSANTSAGSSANTSAGPSSAGISGGLSGLSSTAQSVFSESISQPDTVWRTAGPGSGADADIRVSFGEKDFTLTPYLKKFDMFAATWAWQNLAGGSNFFSSDALGTIPSIAKLRPESIRTDLFMGYGGIGRPIANSATLKGTTAAEFTFVKELTSRWKDSGIRGNIAYFANPVYSGGGADGDRWKTKPDETKWNEVCYNIAKYLKDNDINVMTHEIWNEPDFYSTSPQTDGVFFSGSWQDYIDTYIAGATGIRAADKDAIVGGVSAAWIKRLASDGRYANFLNQVKAAGAPLDFVSWHYYGYYGKFDGNTSSDADLDTYITAARGGLSGDSAFSTVQQHLNEFNVTIQSFIYQSYDMTQSIFDVFQRLLSATDITRISWAAPLEQSNTTPVLSLINPVTFKRYPSFHTIWMYARLPVERVHTANTTDGVEILAARDGGRAGVILYDTANQTQDVELSLEGIGMDRYDVTVYSIDKDNPVSDPLSDEPRMLAQYNDRTASDVFYNITVPKEGAVYIEINSRSEGAALDYKSKYSSKVVRKDYWYPQRGDNYAFADIHMNSMSAYVGSGFAKEGLGSACSVTLENMKGESFNVRYETVGSPSKKSGASMLGVKVDYEVNGSYTKSVYFYIDSINGSATIPLGTKKAADQSVSMGSGKGSYALALDTYAPSGWNGRVQIAFVVNDIGRNNGAIFYIR